MPRRSSREAGSLILDVLIGMAIFALIAVIAVSAVGQYRMRAYVQAAVSDAQQLAYAIAGAAVDQKGFPTGLLTEEQLASAGVIPTGSGTQRSVFHVEPSMVRDGEFDVCVEHRGAFAVHETRRGLVASGPITASGFMGCDYTPTDPPGDPDATGLDKPVVTATPRPGTRIADVTWEPIDGADSYELFLDGATEPTWTGPDTETALNDLALGDHEVVVVAIAPGKRSEPSDPAPFTIDCSNDYIACPTPVADTSPGVPYHLDDETNVGTTREAGEPSGHRSMWWTVTTNRRTTYEFRAVADSTGAGPFTYPQIDVYEGSAATMGELGPRISQTEVYGTSHRTRFFTEVGVTYMVRVSGGEHSPGPFRLRVATGPENDSLPEAIPVVTPGIDPWESPDLSNVFAGQEPGEDLEGAHGSMWWTMTAARSGSIRLSVFPATTGDPLPQYLNLAAWQSSSTDVTDLPLSDALARNNLDKHIDFAVVAGQTYKMRVSANGDVARGDYRVRLEMGPENDVLAHAAPVYTPNVGATLTSGDYTNRLAGQEAGEPDYGTRGVWFTFTPSRTGRFEFGVIQATDGTPLFTYPQIRAWQTTTSDVTQLGTRIAANNLTPRVTIDAVAGQTYKFRVALMNGSSAVGGPFRYTIRGAS